MWFSHNKTIEKHKINTNEKKAENNQKKNTSVRGIKLTKILKKPRSEGACAFFLSFFYTLLSILTCFFPLLSVPFFTFLVKATADFFTLALTFFFSSVLLLLALLDSMLSPISLPLKWAAEILAYSSFIHLPSAIWSFLQKVVFLSIILFSFLLLFSQELKFLHRLLLQTSKFPSFLTFHVHDFDFPRPQLLV